MSNTSGVNSNQQLWEKGDFTAIAEAFMREPGADLVASLGVTKTMRVLDLGCGDGTTALPLAERAGEVLGVDIARNLVDAGNERAATAGLQNLRFEHGDASALTGLADASFDLSMSIFGAMFCPKPFEVASEMVRVTKPGGRVIMGNWIPNDPTSFVSDILKISAAYTPPPPEGFVSPMLWGVESEVHDRFGRAGIPADKISTSKDEFVFTSARHSCDDWVRLMRDYYGPTMNAYEAARTVGKEDELHRQLTELTHAHNRDGAGGVQVRATYLRITIAV
jgi:SAM-dependent methyltransferase